MYYTNWEDIPKRRYICILADPPWSYRDKRDGNDRNAGSASNQYDTMNVKDIAALPVDELAESDAILFMWATFPNLPEALAVMAEWGFTYKTLGFSWIKTNRKSGTPFFGIGAYTKSNCEVCLIGVRGKPLQYKVSNAVSSVLISPIGAHSRKPDEARQRIVSLMGDVPRIELFSRGGHTGWDCWGNTPAFAE